MRSLWLNGADRARPAPPARDTGAGVAGLRGKIVAAAVS